MYQLLKSNIFKEKEANVTFAAKPHVLLLDLKKQSSIILTITTTIRFLQLLFNNFMCVRLCAWSIRSHSLTHQQSVCFHRNPPPDHWALISGLPTYVAESGFVSLLALSLPAVTTKYCAHPAFQLSDLQHHERRCRRDLWIPGERTEWLGKSPEDRPVNVGFFVCVCHCGRRSLLITAAGPSRTSSRCLLSTKRRR